MEPNYKNGVLHLENIDLIQLAKKEKTPLYVYSKKSIIQSINEYFNNYQKKLLLCFAQKANSNINILKLMASRGVGCDIVSGGELYRALTAGMDPRKIVFSGVCKTKEEILYALKNNILMINAESTQELEAINEVAKGYYKKNTQKAPVSLRINPDINPKTHAYISTGLKKHKFGITEDKAKLIIQSLKSYSYIKLIGISSHIGSQILDLNTFSDAIDKILGFIKDTQLSISFLNFGGGLGIAYNNETVPTIKSYMQLLSEKIKDRDVTLILEPGRRIVGNAGVLLGRVHYIKENENKKFYLSDVGMNDLVRPSMYNAYHRVLPCAQTSITEKVDLVGPICESGDTVFVDREINRVQKNDYFALLSAGAYGFSMSSNYNSRPRASEILVDDNTYTVIRKRETYKDLIKGEKP